MEATEACPHSFIVDGLRYKHSDYPMPGGGARRRTYYRLFRCSSCFERRAEALEYSDDSYGKVQFGAEPASNAELAVMR